MLRGESGLGEGGRSIIRSHPFLQSGIIPFSDVAYVPYAIGCVGNVKRVSVVNARGLRRIADEDADTLASTARVGGPAGVVRRVAWSPEFAADIL